MEPKRRSPTGTSFRSPDTTKHNVLQVTCHKTQRPAGHVPKQNNVLRSRATKQTTIRRQQQLFDDKITMLEKCTEKAMNLLKTRQWAKQQRGLI